MLRYELWIVRAADKHKAFCQTVHKPCGKERRNVRAHARLQNHRLRKFLLVTGVVVVAENVKNHLGFGLLML